MREAEMAQIGALIGEALDRPSDDVALDRIRHRVREMARQFPLYASRLKD